MPVDIALIQDNESGLSVRTKLNQLIAGAKTGDLGLVTPEDVAAMVDFVAPGKPTGLTITSVAEPSPLMTIVWDFAPEDDFAYYDLQVKEGTGSWIGYQTSSEIYPLSVLPNTTYSAKLRAVDKSGNASVYCDAVNHITAKDTVPPAMPIGVEQATGLDTVWLKWIANTESDLARYEIYESESTTTPADDATPSHSTVANNFVRAGLPMETTSYFWVRAVDTSENRSPWSASVTATTGVIRGEIHISLNGVVFQPGQGAGNRLMWSSGSINYGHSREVPTVQAIPSGQVEWTAGTVYVRYIPGDNKITTTTSLVDVYANDALILGVYKGGTDFQLVEGKAYTDGGLILAQTVGANQLVANAAVITGTAQIADAIITDAKILELSAATLKAGTAIAESITVDGRSLGSMSTLQVFYDDMSNSDWINFSGNGSWSRVSSGTDVGATGPYLIRTSGDQVRRYSPDLIAFDPSKLYRVTFKLVQSGSAVGNKVYLGVFCFDGDRNRVDGVTGGATGCYCVASGIEQSTISPYAPMVGYIKGTSLTGSLGDGTITGAAKLPNGVRYISPMAFLNFGAGPTYGTVWLDSVKIEQVDEFAADIVNAGSTKILPGQVLISGGTSLSSWIYGGDNTSINGGYVAANTLAANSGVFGLRGIDVAGLEFEHNTPGFNQVSWSSGTITYTGDDGNIATRNIVASNALWSSGTLYIYYTQGGTNLLTTTAVATANAANNVILATYRGGRDLNANYGRTVVDGLGIKTGSITAAQADIASFRTNILVAGSISASMMAVSALSAISANMGTVTAGIIQSPNGKFVITLSSGKLEWFD